MNHDIPDKPWPKGGTDLFKVQKRTYLIVMDNYTKYFEIRNLLHNIFTNSDKHMKKYFQDMEFPN